MDGRARRLRPQRSGAGAHQYRTDGDQDAHGHAEPVTHFADSVAQPDGARPEPERIDAGKFTNRSGVAAEGVDYMLNVLCYTAGFILLVLAAVLPANAQRDRLAYTGLALWLLPTTVHTLQHH